MMFRPSAPPRRKMQISTSPRGARVLGAKARRGIQLGQATWAAASADRAKLRFNISRRVRVSTERAMFESSLSSDDRAIDLTPGPLSNWKGVGGEALITDTGRR